MADCEFVLPCESVIASADELLSIENTGGGGAIKARSTSQPAVQATSNDGVAIVGASFGNHGILGLSNPDNPDNSTSAGVFGIAKGFSGFSPMATGVSGSSRSAPGIVGGSQDNVGVVGRSKTDDGVLGLSESDVGVIGRSMSTGGNIGVVGECNPGTGVFGSGVRGVQGIATSPGTGVSGIALREGNGVEGIGVSGTGVLGTSKGGDFVSVGVEGRSLEVNDGFPANYGVCGMAKNSGLLNIGVIGSASVGSAVSGNGIGVMGMGIGKESLAGRFSGDVVVTGFLSKAGGGFKIDHPLEPAGKYFSHSFVESSEMKNVYDGIVILDCCGDGVVQLPDWFEALNGDFRYQLTSIGGPAPDLHIAQEITNSTFTVAGGKPEMKVSWQVTGIRKDPWAQAHPMVVEEEKTSSERGYYQNPELYSQPPENSILWRGNSALMRQLSDPQDSSSQEVPQVRKQIDSLREKMLRQASYLNQDSAQKYAV